MRLEAERFRFVPARVRVAAGERVALELRSRDVEHGFALEELGIEVIIPPAGGPVVGVTFAAPPPGRYSFQCARVCGAGHAAMRGVLIVTEPAARSVSRQWTATKQHG